MAYESDILVSESTEHAHDTAPVTAPADTEAAALTPPVSAHPERILADAERDETALANDIGSRAVATTTDLSGHAETDALLMAAIGSRLDVPAQRPDAGDARAADHQSGDRRGDGEPPERGDDVSETGGEEDPRAVLTRRYQEMFATSVRTLQSELEADEHIDPVNHPGFVGFDNPNQWVGTFRIGAADTPEDRQYQVQLPLIPLDRGASAARAETEEGRVDAFLGTDKLQPEARACLLQIVAHDPETHLSVTEDPGTPIDQLPPEQWAGPSSRAAVAQLRDAAIDMGDHGLMSVADHPNLSWNSAAQRIVIGNYRMRRPDDANAMSGRMMGLHGFRATAETAARHAPTPERGGRMRELANGLLAEHLNGPDYLGDRETNMPDLVVVTGGRDGPRVRVSGELEEEIWARTGSIERPLHLAPVSHHVKALLDGLAHGKSQEEIGDELGLSRRTMSRISSEVQGWLGVPDQVSALYRVHLHHSLYISPPGAQVERPQLTTNESVHLYMAAMGFSRNETAAKLGLEPATVKQHRNNIMGKFGASSMSQTIAHAFASKYFRPFRPHLG